MQEMAEFVCIVIILTIGCLSTSISSQEYDTAEKNYNAVSYDYDSAWPPLKSCKPQHVHLSFGISVLQMNIVWATGSYCQGCKVKYGTDPWDLHLTSVGSYNHFTENNNEGLQHLYKAELENLVPNVTYHYMPVCDGMTSGPHFFKVPRIDLDWAPSFLVFGDLGVESEFFSSLMGEAQSGQYTAVFHVGDFAYNFIDEGGKKGDRFMELIEPASAFMPYMTSPGNHEIDRDSFSHYRNRFTMPGCDWPIPVDKMWYSFDIGHVHFVSYSTEVFFTNDGIFIETQRQWLLKDLETANRNRNVTPWVVAFGHRPLYCSTHIGDDCSQPISIVREELEDIFYSFSVDIILQAHEHNYERLWPVYKGKVTNFSYVNADAPIQIISGAPGSREGEDRFPNQLRPHWSAFRKDDEAVNSYGRLVVMNSTHIWWEQRLAHNHTTLDSIWIIKDEISWEISDRSTNKSILATNGYSKISDSLSNHMLEVGILCVGLMSVVITVVIAKIVLRRKQKSVFNQTWQNPRQEQEDDIDLDLDEIGDSTSLLNQ